MTSQAAAVPRSTVNDRSPRVPMGILVACALIAFGVGFGTATWAVPTSWPTALLAGVVLLAVSLGVAWGAARSAGPAMAVVILTMGMLTLAYWEGLALAISSLFLLYRHMVRPLVAFPLMILIGAAGTVLPFVALVALFRLVRPPRPAAGGQLEQPRPDARPMLLMATVSMAMTTIALTVVVVVIFVTVRGPASRMVLPVGVGLGLPFVLMPAGARLYRALLARWSVPVPPALTIAQNRLREATRFEFARVLCLDAAFGNGRPCFVIVADFNVTLVVSEQIVQRLAPDELLAVLAHEAAHVHLHHGRRMLLWGAVGAVCYVGAAVVLNRVTFAVLPASAGFVRVLIPMMPLLLLRRMYDLQVTRRHEAEADDYAVAVSGAAPLLSALEALAGTGHREQSMHNRWTTHGTWERRRARIRAGETP